jgi:hypothetical protein
MHQPAQQLRKGVATVVTYTTPTLVPTFVAPPKAALGGVSAPLSSTHLGTAYLGSAVSVAAGMAASWQRPAFHAAGLTPVTPPPATAVVTDIRDARAAKQARPPRGVPR